MDPKYSIAHIRRLTCSLELCCLYVMSLKEVSENFFFPFQGDFFKNVYRIYTSTVQKKKNKCDQFQGLIGIFHFQWSSTENVFSFRDSFQNCSSRLVFE